MISRTPKKIQYMADVPGSAVSLPVTEITGAAPGPVFLITAGIHGGEYPGIAASMELARLLQPEDIAGAVILIHASNPDRFWDRRAECGSRSEENLNRCFPGSAGGNEAERLARFLTDRFILRADFYADCHSGDIHEDLCAHVYYPLACREEVSRISREMAALTDVPYIIPSRASGNAYSSAAAAGIPAILIEHGGNGLCLDTDIRAFRNDLIRLLRYAGILRSGRFPAEPMKETPREVQRVIYPEAPHDTCWRTSLCSGGSVRRGDVLGYTTDIFGNGKKEWTAEADGVILYINTSLTLRKGNHPAVYAVL